MPRAARPAALTAGGAAFEPSPTYDTLWRYAAARQDAFLRRAAGLPPPWTDDPVLLRWRFTNVYRASDRVSQYLIRNVIYLGDQDHVEVTFRTLLFKMFNRPATWELLVAALGQQPSWARASFKRMADALDAARADGRPIYSAAFYIRSPKAYGQPLAHLNHLKQLQHMMSGGVAAAARRARTLAELVAALRAVPEIGPFLSWQNALDLNYGPHVNLSEDEPGAVVAGPGALDGLGKLFAGGVPPRAAPLAINELARRAPAEFDRLGLDFPGLWGRPLTAADVEHLLCEVSKYTRASAPDVAGPRGSTHIKLRFHPDAAALDPPPPQWYPPKWGLNETVRRWYSHRAAA